MLREAVVGADKRDTAVKQKLRNDTLTCYDRPIDEESERERERESDREREREREVKIVCVCVCVRVLGITG